MTLLSNADFLKGWSLLIGTFRYNDADGAERAMRLVVERLATPEAWRWVTARIAATRTDPFGPTPGEVVAELSLFPGYGNAEAEAKMLACYPSASRGEVRLYLSASDWESSARYSLKNGTQMRGGPECIAVCERFRAKHMTPVEQRDRQAGAAIEAAARAALLPAPAPKALIASTVPVVESSRVVEVVVEPKSEW
jgi:hypothetical protein